MEDAEDLFLKFPQFLDGFNDFLDQAFPEQRRAVIEKEAQSIAAHQEACQRQSTSQLLRLPRELRDKIWDEVNIGNIIHVSSTTVSAPFNFQLHYCRAPRGLQSSACPPGIGDHADCVITGSGQPWILKGVCKQIQLELPDSVPGSEVTFFSNNAFQFANLPVAEEYLFGLTEAQRAAITHLRFALPCSLSPAPPDELVSPDCTAWQSIVNYFSNPWDRNCVCPLLSQLIHNSY